jgi:hypothetical protein
MCGWFLNLRIVGSPGIYPSRHHWESTTCQVWPSDRISFVSLWEAGRQSVALGLLLPHYAQAHELNQIESQLYELRKANM